MTAIPEPTEEDFELLKIGIDIWYETNSRKSPQGQSADWQKDDLAALRLLSHYQRENERLKDENSELREKLKEAEEKIAQLEEVILSGLAADAESEVSGE